MIGFRVSHHARINDLADGACEWKSRKKKPGKVYNDGVLDTLFNGSTDETIDI